MSCLVASRRRYIPVKVADVPIEKCRHAARVAIRREDDVMECWRIIMLAEDPGELVAWVAP